MTNFNKRFFGKDRPTNVISFSYIENNEKKENESFADEVMGDIIISLEKAQEEAEMISCGFYERLFALIIHGILHILGYDHTGDPNEARKMRYREKKLLNHVRSHKLYKQLIE